MRKVRVNSNYQTIATSYLNNTINIYLQGPYIGDMRYSICLRRETVSTGIE